MCCDELWGRSCNDIGADECPEEIELEEVEEINAKAKNIKIEHGTTREKITDKKPKVVKVSNEKTQIFNTILDILNEKYVINVLKDNKLIEIELNGKKFKVDLIEQRQKK